MAYVASTNKHFHLGAWVRNLFATLSERAEKRDAYYATYNELSRLSDRDLADLGISRSEISAIAHQAAYADA